MADGRGSDGGALVVIAAKSGVWRKNLEKTLPRVAEILSIPTENE